MAELYPVQNDYPDPFEIPPPERIPQPGTQTLYYSATGFEKAAADTDAERLMDIYAEAIIDQWNPWQVAYEHLPFLAWAQGVNLWETYWDETFRRNWVARQWYLKSIRGKRAGLDEFVSAVRGHVKRCVVPPARAYGTKKQTVEERAAYVARFPQLRIYPYVAREQLQWLCFTGKHYDGTGQNRIFQKNGSFLGPLWKLYPTVQDAGGKYTRTATIYEPRTGVETKLTIRKVEKIDMGPGAGWGYTPGVSQYDEEVILPLEKRPNYFIGEAGKFLGGGGKHGIFLGVQLPLRTISIGRSGFLDFYQGKAQYQTIFPQEELLNVRPEYVAIRHPRRPTELYAARGEYLSRPSKLCSHLVASSLQIGPPEFGRATAKGFAAEDFRTASPVIGVAVLKQHHFGLTAVGLVPRSPALGEPGYRIKNATNLSTSAPVFGTALLRYSAFGVTTSAGHPTFTVPAFKQGHKLNSFAVIVSAPTFTRPGYAIRTVNMTTGSPVLGAPVLVHLFQPMPIQQIVPRDFSTGAPVFGNVRVRGGRPTGKYLPRSNAWQFMYERFYLFDADRAPDQRAASYYMGACRFGIHKYTAEALIKITADMPQFYVSTTRYLRGFFRPKQNEAIPRLLRGVRASMAVRDTVLVDTTVTRTIQLRDVHAPDGRHYVGEQTEN